MGEAKRKKPERDAALEKLQKLDLANVAAAVGKLFRASSLIQGGDCYGYAAHVQALLKRLGVTADIAVGHAAWRIGDGAHDTIAHHPKGNHTGLSVGYAGREGMLYHAWLEVAGRILDLSTRTLRRKAAMMDAADGFRTTVKWCPDYVLADKREVLSLKDVVNGRGAGLFHYERVPELERMARANARPTDEDEMAMVWMLYRQPDMVLIGLNDMFDVSEDSVAA